jgi:N-acylneuraminate cytidylyltransferase
MSRDNAWRVAPVFPERTDERSQDLPDLFCPTGAIWWARADVLRCQKTFHIFGRTGCELPWREAVDIDVEADWQLAELLMQARHRGETCHEAA